ncbi:MAG: hypothetical protein HYT03_02070 [Candidatus Harrisonbacteria bacterium]|nr:hypothetical protein [Candidatus Harrisonbacteria bacterium]
MILRFRRINKDIFEAIKRGNKRIETRAATKKYKNIKTGDKVILSCGRDKFEKHVKKAKIYKKIGSLLRKYKPTELNPHVKTAKEIETMLYSFPGYKTKINKCGIIALELE